MSMKPEEIREAVSAGVHEIRMRPDEYAGRPEEVATIDRAARSLGIFGVTDDIPGATVTGVEATPVDAAQAVSDMNAQFCKRWGVPADMGPHSAVDPGWEAEMRRVMDSQVEIVEVPRD